MLKKFIRMLDKEHKNSLRGFIRTIFGRDLYIKIRFFLTHHYFLNLKRPKTWNEKIQNRKIFCDPNELCHFVDKYEVRKYVESKVGSQYLIPLIAKFDRLKVSDFNDLPNEIVIKTTNGGGGEHVKVIYDLSSAKIDELVDLFNGSVSEQLGKYVDEPFYDIIPASVIVEELISNFDDSPLLDYKFHVFSSCDDNCIFLQINSNYGRDDETKTLYDLKGNKTYFQFHDYKYGDEKIELPSNFDAMVDVASKLASEFMYARVDLYNVDGKIYFGEITLCPASGWDRINSKDNDIYLGSLWK